MFAASFPAWTAQHHAAAQPAVGDPVGGHLQRAHHRRADPAGAARRALHARAARRSCCAATSTSTALGGIIAPFIGIKLIDLVVQFFPGCPDMQCSSPGFASTGPRCARCSCFTVVLGIVYPLSIWLIAQLPGLHDKAEGSIVKVDGKPVGSRLIGQSFTDANGNPLTQYFQSRPSAAGDGYDPTATGASNLGPESIVDTLADPKLPPARADAGKPSLLTQVCSRSAAVGELDGVDGSRPFCTADGVGAVLSVIGPRDARGNVVHPTRVVSVNEPARPRSSRSSSTYDGVRVRVRTSSARTTRSARSCRSAELPRPIRRCRRTPSPPAAAAWIPDISPGLRRSPGRHGSPRHAGSPRTRCVNAVADNHDGRDLGLHRRAAGQRAGTQPRTRPEISRSAAESGGWMMSSRECPQRHDHGPKRGELRIYLGAAPGVGKTFAMLGEAHRRPERGTDVVAAVVETHGRRKTAELLEGIEIIPPQYIEYRGSRFAELDVPAVLARQPAGGAGRRARTHQHAGQQEPETLAGRRGTARRRHHGDLHGQHPAPGEPQRRRRADHRHRATGDRARRRRRRAEQIELVDITPEALRRRLSHGNVYAPEKIDAALSNYFRIGNLTALRELALLWLADQVDAALAKYRQDNKITETWEARERVVVAVTGGPESETLVRRASRIATKSSAELMVVHVVARRRTLWRRPHREWARSVSWPPASTRPAHRGRRRRANRAAGFRPRDERHPAGARHVPPVALGAHLRRGHRRPDRAAVRQDRRAHGDP